VACRIIIFAQAQYYLTKTIYASNAVFKLGWVPGQNYVIIRRQFRCRSRPCRTPLLAKINKRQCAELSRTQQEICCNYTEFEYKIGQRNSFICADVQTGEAGPCPLCTFLTLNCGIQGTRTVFSSAGCIRLIAMCTRAPRREMRYLSSAMACEIQDE
jgi:hypothetical protein